MPVFVYVYIHICLYIYIYAYTHVHTYIQFGPLPLLPALSVGFEALAPLVYGIESVPKDSRLGLHVKGPWFGLKAESPVFKGSGGVCSIEPYYVDGI